jgi:hypothetical protein
VSVYSRASRRFTTNNARLEVRGTGIEKPSRRRRIFTSGHARTPPRETSGIVQATYPSPPFRPRVLYLFQDARHVPPRMAAAATRPGHSHRRPPPPPLGRSPGGGAGLCPMAPTPGDLPTSSPNAQAPSHALRPGNNPSRFLPPAPTMCSPVLLRCVGCSTSFPTLEALCAHLNPPGTTCTFADDTFGAVALVGTNILVLTAILRPHRRRHAVLRFRAVGRLRCIPSPCPPPSNCALAMGPLVGRAPKLSSSPTTFPSDLVRPRTASPLRWYAS